jgi:hypothetical protein
MFVTLENPESNAVFLSKGNSIHLGKKGQNTPASNADCIDPKDACISPFLLKRVFFKK